MCNYIKWPLSKWIQTSSARSRNNPSLNLLKKIITNSILGEDHIKKMKLPKAAWCNTLPWKKELRKIPKLRSGRKKLKKKNLMENIKSLKPWKHFLCLFIFTFLKDRGRERERETQPPGHLWTLHVESQSCWVFQGWGCGSLSRAGAWDTNTPFQGYGYSAFDSASCKESQEVADDVVGTSHSPGRPGCCWILASAWPSTGSVFQI